MSELDEAAWVGRARATLTHIPPTNDPDDSADILAGAVTTPAAQRLADALRWEQQPDHCPRQLLTHCGTYLRGHLTSAGAYAGLQREDYAAAAYLFGRNDEAAEAAAEDRGAAGGLAFVAGGFAGFVLCLALVVLGAVLMGLRLA